MLVEEATEITAASVASDAAPNELAGWHIRAAALAVDILPGLAVVVTMALVSFTVPLRSPWWWVSTTTTVVVLLVMWGNRVAQPFNGRTLGRALLGIAVIRPDGARIEPWRLLVRDFAHLLDTLSVGVGWLWPLWDSRRRTFADVLLNTEVHCVPVEQRPARIRRHTAMAAALAVLLCVAGAAISVFTIYLPDRAAGQTRSDVQAQGPKIVAQMLTYDPQTLEKDFARARSLTTDKYRPELVRQQESVQKGHPVVNEYWVTDSTVLSAARDTATMLLFMQGHRGGGGEERFITATVRVAFVKGKNGQWLVDNLDVVTKPKPAPPKAPVPPTPPKGQK